MTNNDMNHFPILVQEVVIFFLLPFCLYVSYDENNVLRYMAYLECLFVLVYVFYHYLQCLRNRLITW